MRCGLSQRTGELMPVPDGFEIRSLSRSRRKRPTAPAAESCSVLGASQTSSRVAAQCEEQIALSLTEEARSTLLTLSQGYPLAPPRTIKGTTS